MRGDEGNSPEDRERGAHDGISEDGKESPVSSSHVSAHARHLRRAVAETGNERSPRPSSRPLVETQLTTRRDDVASVFYEIKTA